MTQLPAPELLSSAHPLPIRLSVQHNQLRSSLLHSATLSDGTQTVIGVVKGGVYIFDVNGSGSSPSSSANASASTSAPTAPSSASASARPSFLSVPTASTSSAGSQSKRLPSARLLDMSWAPTTLSVYGCWLAVGGNEGKLSLARLDVELSTPSMKLGSKKKRITKNVSYITPVPQSQVWSTAFSSDLNNHVWICPASPSHFHADSPSALESSRNSTHLDQQTMLLTVCCNDSRILVCDPRSILEIKHMLTTYEQIYSFDYKELIPQPQLVSITNTPSLPNHSSFSPDMRTLLVGCDSPLVHMYSHADGKLEALSSLKTSDDVHDQVFCTAWSADGRKFVVGTQGGRVVLWDVRSSIPLRTIRVPSAGVSFPAASSSMSLPYAVRSVRFSPLSTFANEEMLLFTEHSRCFNIVSLETGQHTRIQIPTKLIIPSSGSRLSMSESTFSMPFALLDKPYQLSLDQSQHHAQIASFTFNNLGTSFFIGIEDAGVIRWNLPPVMRRTFQSVELS